jgi:tetratricopeptide (TPR) repeat protein
MMVLENPTSPTVNFEDPHKPQYSAFISYSHADSKIAEWLQHSIERFTIPKSLVGRETNRGRVPKKLARCFRDRDELATSADLSSEIQAALAVSRNLIVVCSPAAAISPWVEREIIEFKKLHGAERVFALIAGGEPFATADMSNKECFPRALRFQLGSDGFLSDIAAEPIAADIRPGKETRRAALLKMIAGILGVGLDELARREAQRRQKVISWILGGTTATALSFAAIAIVAIQQRNIAVTETERAIKKRHQAEALIGFMVDDLRKQLEPVGRLSVMNSVLEHAKTYFAELSADELDADALRQKAAVQLVESQVKGNAGDNDGALLAINDAVATLRLGERLYPDSLELTAMAAAQLSELGVLNARLRRQEESIRAFDQSLASYEKLFSTAANVQPDWRRGYANTLISKGAVLYSKADYRTAKEQFEKSATIIKELRDAGQTNHDLDISYSNTLAWLSDAHRRLGALRIAIGVRDQQRSFLQSQLEKDPNDKDMERDALEAERRLAQINFDLGAFEESYRGFRAVERRLKALSDFDPQNMKYRASLVGAQLQLAAAAIKSQRTGEARQILAEVDRSITSTPRDSANDFFANRKLERIHVECLLESGLRNSEKVVELAADTVNKASKSPEKNILESERIFTSEILLMSAEARLRLGQNAAAAQEFEVLMELVRAAPEPRPVRLNASLLQAILGLGQDAEPLLSQVCSSEYSSGFTFCKAPRN